jgi:large subunit ribosomal protein L23
MKTKYDILLSPVVTEKAYQENQKYNRYVFRIHPQANKVQVKQAVEEIFRSKKVKVLSVHTSHVKGRRRGRVKGQRGVSAAWKKAIVTLNPECKLDLY